jgi:hypothetical protein
MAAARSLCGVLAVVCVLVPRSGSAQDLADLDYAYLNFRGIGFDWGYLWPKRVEPTGSVALRFDMGYAGPGLRIMPSLTYWSSPFEQSEVTELEDRIEALIGDQGGGVPPDVDLGSIEWQDVAIGLDGHVVWDAVFGLLPYGGLGIAMHVLDGSGDAIDDTLIDDLLDSLTAGFNLHLGVEYPISPRLRVYSVGKYEVLSDFQYFTARLGLQFMWGPLAPGEER